MISDQDRSGWFGASDTAMIMGSWGSKTFKKWWMQKLGLDTSRITTTAMNAGTYYEHAVLDVIGAPRRDHQILLPEYRLRVNLDGDGLHQLYEVKTHKAEKEYKPTKAHWQQVQVQMFAKLQDEDCLPKAQIISYGLLDEDYRNFFNDIDPGRLRRHEIRYDGGFICGYLERLVYLAGCLEKGRFPDAGAFLSLSRCGGSSLIRGSQGECGGQGSGRPTGSKERRIATSASPPRNDTPQSASLTAPLKGSLGRRARK